MTKRGKSVVLMHGVFDLMHSNHIEAMRVARSFGDWLIVFVHCDAVVDGYKRLPILNEQERLKQVQAVRHVDEALIDYEVETAARHEALYQQYQPDHYVYFGPGFDAEFMPYSSRGILRRLPYHEGISTSAIIATVRRRIEEGKL